MKKLVCLAIIVISLTFAGSAFAVPIYCPLNSHYYEVVRVNLSWANAKTAAESKIFQGVNGHLAVLTSATENSWVWNNLGANLGDYWLGGYQPAGSGEPNSAWTWVTGELWSWTNWDTVEPNQWVGGEEDYLIFSTPNATVGNVGQGHWNDTLSANYGSTPGYIVEYPIPEPTTMALFGISLAGCAFLKRKRK